MVAAFHPTYVLEVIFVPDIDFGKIAGVLAILGYVPYLISVVRQKTTPNPATWWVWAILGGIVFSSYYAAGNRGDSLWVPLGYVVGPLLIAILSVRFGRNAFGRFENFCLVGAAASLGLWQLSGSPLVALIFLLLVDFLGFLPTLKKTYFEPDSEDLLSWIVFGVANTLNLFAIEQWNYATAVYPLYLFCLPTIILVLILRGKLSASLFEG